MRITLDYLKKKRACPEGVAAFKQRFGESAELADVINYAIEGRKMRELRYANWLVVRCMTKPQQIAYAIYAAELVLYIYEAKYPDGNAPSKAIGAAKAYLANPCVETRNAAAYAAAYAAYTAHAAYAAADAAADAAAYAAYAACAVYAAAYAAYAAVAADADAAADVLSKILARGLEIIKPKQA